METKVKDIHIQTTTTLFRHNSSIVGCHKRTSKAWLVSTFRKTLQIIFKIYNLILRRTYALNQAPAPDPDSSGNPSLKRKKKKKPVDQRKSKIETKLSQQRKPGLVQPELTLGGVGGVGGKVAGPLPFWPPAPLPHRPQ